ncbi:MAG: MaoC family dehydratase [Lachnospiraceae bacterium]|nr:MaoC family dehydratase [Lachnospiraceae bacterium]
MILSVGQNVSSKNTITVESIEKYAEITGDYNPIHFDREFAKTSIFGERIAHGMLSAGYISALIGMKLPGKGTVYLKQEINFLLPVKVGDEITTTVTIEECINSQKGIYRLRTVCVNQKDQMVVTGEAIVKWKEQK